MEELNSAQDDEIGGLNRKHSSKCQAWPSSDIVFYQKHWTQLSAAGGSGKRATRSWRRPSRSFGRLAFGRLAFGRLAFGRLAFGRLAFGRLASATSTTSVPFFLTKKDLLKLQEVVRNNAQQIAFWNELVEANKNWISHLLSGYS
jgi:hypothetical protein